MPPPDMDGFSHVSSHCCEESMETWLRAFIPSQGLEICNEGGLIGFLPYVICNKMTYEVMLAAFLENSISPCPWLRTAGKCTLSSQSCPNMDSYNASAHRQRRCNTSFTAAAPKLFLLMSSTTTSAAIPPTTGPTTAAATVDPMMSSTPTPTAIPPTIGPTTAAPTMGPIMSSATTSAAIVPTRLPPTTGPTMGPMMPSTTTPTAIPPTIGPIKAAATMGTIRSSTICVLRSWIEWTDPNSTSGVPSKL